MVRKNREGWDTKMAQPLSMDSLVRNENVGGLATGRGVLELLVVPLEENEVSGPLAGVIGRVVFPPNSISGPANPVVQKHHRQ